MYRPSLKYITDNDGQVLSGKFYISIPYFLFQKDGFMITFSKIISASILAFIFCSFREGDCAARNIIRDALGLKLIRDSPVDLGYIIPMANNYSGGRILRINLQGKLPTLWHYLMCIYRSYSWGKRMGFAKDLLIGVG